MPFQRYRSNATRHMLVYSPNMPKNRLVLCSALSALITFTVIAPSHASPGQEYCTDSSPSSYLCAATYGYRGEDPYNMDRFSPSDSQGNKHSCTSLAAYMLWYRNSYDADIGYFNSAQYWDTDALRVADARVTRTPHLGDIAQWDADNRLAQGHVAWVSEITYSPSGAIERIAVVDDNATRLVTTGKYLYPRETSLSGTISWPDHFITFPGFVPSGGGIGGGGGPHLIAYRGPSQ